MSVSGDFKAVKGYQSGVTAAAEDYLEMIYRNSEISGHMRINFLAAKLNVPPAAAARMVQHLKELGLVEFEKYGLITMTAKGREFIRVNLSNR